MMVVDGQDKRGSLTVSLLQSGDRFDIKRKRVKANE